VSNLTRSLTKIGKVREKSKVESKDGSPSWIRIEPCAMPRNPPFGGFWKIFASCVSPPKRSAIPPGSRRASQHSRAFACALIRRTSRVPIGLKLWLMKSATVSLGLALGSNAGRALLESLNSIVYVGCEGSGPSSPRYGMDRLSAELGKPPPPRSPGARRAAAR
jgi:hypothetical protein